MAFGQMPKCDLCRKRKDPMFHHQGKTVCEDCRKTMERLAKDEPNASGYSGPGGEPTKPMGYKPNQKLSRRAQKENEEWLKKHGKDKK